MFSTYRTHRQARLPRRRPLAAAGTDRLQRRDDPGSAGHVVCTVGERELADDHTVHVAGVLIRFDHGYQVVMTTSTSH